LQTIVRDNGHEKFVWVLEINCIRQPRSSNRDTIFSGPENLRPRTKTTVVVKPGLVFIVVANLFYEAYGCM